MTMDASITSLRETSPISAERIGTSIPFKIFKRASNDPRVSALTTTPTSSVWIFMFSISWSIFSFTSSRFPRATRRGDPETTLSMWGATILIPAAATTSSTFLKRFLASLISSKGLGFKSDLILVTKTSSLVVKAILSSFLKIPSYIMVSMVVPRPTSSLTSRIVPRAGASVSICNCSCKYSCASPRSMVKSSAMPSPVLALMGMMLICLAKLLTRSKRSDSKPSWWRVPTSS